MYVVYLYTVLYGSYAQRNTMLRHSYYYTHTHTLSLTSQRILYHSYYQRTAYIYSIL